MALRRRHAQTVRDNSFSYKIDSVAQTYEILNSKQHQICIIGSKVTATFVNEGILPIGGCASERVFASSLRSRLVLIVKATNLSPISVVLTTGYAAPKDGTS